MSERIAIVGGTGREGLGLGARWARAGHQVRIGSRDAERARARAEEIGRLVGDAGQTVVGGLNGDMVADADVVCLTVPWSAHARTVEALADSLAGKLVLDLTVPLTPPKITHVSLPEGGSVATQTKRLAGPQAQVAAALHHVSSAHLADPGADIDCDVLVCADDPDARQRAMGLVTNLGLAPIDAGPLVNAVALESLTPVLLHINRRYGLQGAGIRITGLSSAHDGDRRAPHSAGA